MFKRKPPRPRTTDPQLTIDELGDQVQWRLVTKARSIHVQFIRTHLKHINVQVSISKWRQHLAAQGKRPLGPIRKCDLITLTKRRLT